MFADTTIITSKEHMQVNLEKFTEMLQKEIGLGINTKVKQITKMQEEDKEGNPILKVIVEIAYEDIM